jgi:acyl-CoA thioester hydrolase
MENMQSKVWVQTMRAGWGDMDFNSHMRNTAYLDKAADMRMLYFSAHGFPMSEFMRLRLGPVILKDEISYAREVHLLEEITVDIACAGMAEDGSQFRILNRYTKADGKPAAQVASMGGWLDLSARRLTLPPPALLQAMQDMPRSDDFSVLPSLIGK